MSIGTVVRRRLRGASATILIVLGATVVMSAPPATAANRAGYGAPVSEWVRAHPENSTMCPVGTCYGPLVASRPRMPQFSFIVTDSHHVVGYEEALPRGTPLLEAELEIAEQFPADTQIARKVTLIPHDRYGHTCAIYDLYSQTLATEFGQKGPGDDGDTIGVELLTATAHGTTYDPDAVTLAIVAPVYLDTSANC